MALLNAQQIDALIAAAKSIDRSSAEQRIEDFATSVLGLNAVQKLEYFSGSPTDDALPLAAGNLEAAWEDLLTRDAVLPSFSVFVRQGNSFISGISVRLAEIGIPAQTISRLLNSVQIRNSLQSIVLGSELEALASVLLDAHCDDAFPTQKSGDQGVDAIGLLRWIDVDGCIGSPFGRAHNVFAVASCKANLGTAAGQQPDTIDPKYIRELIGGWAIQRSEAASWKEAGIKMLSPLQLLLVTTYKLSDSSWSLCERLGVEVWSLPKLIYLISCCAPNDVFPAGGFSGVQLKNWYQSIESRRRQGAVTTGTTA